jgi:hypothetical protein
VVLAHAWCLPNLPQVWVLHSLVLAKGEESFSFGWSIASTMRPKLILAGTALLTLDIALSTIKVVEVLLSAHIIDSKSGRKCECSTA